MSDALILAFDSGGTKTAWATFNEDLRLQETGQYPTPEDLQEYLDTMRTLIEKHAVKVVGLGVAGTISTDHTTVLVSPNIPYLNGVNLEEALGNEEVLVKVDNDARCALIGEVIAGAAQSDTSVVLITIGTGIGGAVMQKGVVLPHPQDVSEEIGRIVVDPNDAFQSPTGRGTVESFIGGKNVENRFGIKLHDIAEKVRLGDPKSKQVWEQISYYFLQSLRAIHMVYSCREIIIGGIGAADLEYYLQGEAPCRVIPAKLGVQAALYGAGRLALDRYHEELADPLDE